MAGVATPHELEVVVPHQLRGARLGAVGEALAAQHLEDDGLVLVARNWRVRSGELVGELDVVALAPDGLLVVCEVKSRRDAERFDGAIAAVGPVKRQRIRRLAAAFLADHPSRVEGVRFDVVALDLAPRGGDRVRLTHLPDAW